MIELISHHDHYFTTVFSIKREVGFGVTIAVCLALFSVKLKQFFGKDVGHLVINLGLYEHIPIYSVL